MYDLFQEIAKTEAELGIKFD
jgi:hypothetical protein